MKSKSERKINPVTSATFQGSGNSQGSLIGICQPLPVLPINSSGGYRSQEAGVGVLNNATPTFQVGQSFRHQPNHGSGVSGPQRTHLNPSSIPAIQQPFLSNSPAAQYGGYGPQKTYSHAASKLPEGHPAFIPNTQGTGVFRPNITHAESLRYAAPSLPPREAINFSGYGGFRPEKTNAETLSHAIPNFPPNQSFSHSNHPHNQHYGGSISERYHLETSNQPFSQSNHQHSQDYGGFRSEKYHFEASRNAPNYTVPWVSVSNQPVQGSGGLLPRMHVERPNYPAPNGQSPYLANAAAGFGHQRAHAEIMTHTPHFQPSQYTLTPRPSGTFMPPHQSYLPAAPYSYREPAGLQRSNDLYQSFPPVPSWNAANMHPYQS